MRTLRSIAAVGCSVTLLGSLSAGCTMIGLGVGAMHDAKQPDTRSLGWSELRSLQPGVYVSVNSRDSSIQRGSFEAIEELSDRDLQTRYAEFIAGNPEEPSLPRWNESVQITLISGERESGIFSGFDYRVDTGGGALPALVLDASMRNRRTLSLAEIASLGASSGGAIPGSDLAAWGSDGRLPFRSAIVLQSHRWPVQVPVDEIVSVSAPAVKNGKRNGAMIGAAIDLAVIVAVVIASQAFGDFSLELSK